MKQVRINNKTVIEVDGRLSDERARKEYLEKISRKVDNNSHKPWEGRRTTKHQNVPGHNIVFKGDNVHKRQNRRMSKI